MTWSGKIGLRVQEATPELEGVSAVLVGLGIQSRLNENSDLSVPFFLLRDSLGQ